MHKTVWKVTIKELWIFLKTNTRCKVIEMFLIINPIVRLTYVLFMWEVYGEDTIFVDLTLNRIVLQIFNSFTQRNSWTWDSVKLNRFNTVILTFEKLLFQVAECCCWFESHIHLINKVELQNIEIFIKWIDLRIDFNYVSIIVLQRRELFYVVWK